MDYSLHKDIREMMTIAETFEYVKRAKGLLDSDAQKSIVDYLSVHPKCGDLIQGAGGVRKLRWQCRGKGKRGGVRVIYFYHNEQMPLDLLTVFAKSEKVNLNKSECNELAKLVKILVDYWGRRVR